MPYQELDSDAMAHASYTPPDAPTNTIEGMADRAYMEFASSIQGSLKLEGAGVDVSRAWQAVLAARSNLMSGINQVTDAAEKVHADTYMSDLERQDRLSMARDLGTAVHTTGTKALERAWAELTAAVDAGAAADLTPADPVERPLIRQELLSHIARATQPASRPGDAFRPGDSVKIALLDLVRANPARYGSEIASDFGKTLVSPAEHAELIRLIKIAVPGQTPMARANRALLPNVAKTAAYTGGLSFAVKQRLEAALNPPTTTRYVGGRLVTTRS